MALSKKHFKIAEILAAFFTRSQTDEDEKRLDAWLKENERNRQLMNRLLNEESYRENLENISRYSTDGSWGRMRIRMKKTRSLPWKMLLPYAAVFILISSIILLFFPHSPGGGEGISEKVVPFKNDMTRAILTLGDGSMIEVTGKKSSVIVEADGSTIRTDSTGLAYFSHLKSEKKSISNTVETMTGMEYFLTLSDGTQVYLNAESKLTFPVQFEGESREVILEGEAYFKVAHDADRSFKVKVDSLTVRVLGTSFNLRSYRDDESVTTTLVEGKVEIAHGQNSLEITPGKQAVYMKSSQEIFAQDVDVALYTAWRSGKFIFKNKRLGEVLSYLSKWYGFEYEFMDEDARDIRIGTSLDRYSNMDPILEMMRTTGLVSVEQKGDKILIYRGVK